METSIGPDANVLAAVGYVIWILGVLFFFVEEDNDFVRFHGLQSAVLGVALFVVFFAVNTFLFVVSLVSDLLGFLLGLFTPLIGLAWFLVVLFMAYKAYQGERYRLPVLGDFVEGQL